MTLWISLLWSIWSDEQVKHSTALMLIFRFSFDGIFIVEFLASSEQKDYHRLRPHKESPQNSLLLDFASVFIRQNPNDSCCSVD